jgi:hypothetical protein
MGMEFNETKSATGDSMSIFDKPVSQIGMAELQELLGEKAVENARLEFKLLIPDKDEILKKFSSFANTFGGFVVFGAKASSSDGRIEDLPGVNKQAGFKQTIVQWCFVGAYPPLTVEVSDPIPVPGGNGKVCYVAYVPESDLAPHFLNGRKGIWVRTDEFSSRFEARLADEKELRHLLDRRKLVRERRTTLLERARRRFDIYAANRHTDKSGNRTKSGPILEVSLAPRFPARPLCEQEKLEPLIDGNILNWRGVGFPMLRNNKITQYESTIILNPVTAISILEANVWGMLFYSTEIDQNESGTNGIHLYGFVGSLLVFSRHAAHALKSLGYSGPLHIEIRLTSIRGVDWLHSLEGPWMSIKPGSGLDDEIIFALTATSEDLYDKSDGVVMQLLRYILFSVDWPSLAEPQSLERLIRQGYTFNSWKPPANLQV